MLRPLKKLIKTHLHEHEPALANDDKPSLAMTAIKRDCEDLFAKVTDKQTQKWVLGILFVAHGHIDAAAKQLPKKEDPQTAYINGLVQRRLGDYAQASYHFRVAAEHPVLPSIAQAFVACEALHPMLRNFPGVLKNETFNPAALTGIIQQVCMGGHVSLEALVRQAQAIEMEYILAASVE